MSHDTYNGKMIFAKHYSLGNEIISHNGAGFGSKSPLRTTCQLRTIDLLHRTNSKCDHKKPLPVINRTLNGIINCHSSI
jgi:hypothetical protein